MPVKNKTENIATSAGVQAQTTATGYLGGLLVRYDVTSGKDTTIQPTTSTDGTGGSFTATGDKYASDDDNTTSYWVYDGKYQQTQLLLEEAGTDTTVFTYTAYQPYITAAEVRLNLKTQDTEYDDESLLMIIHQAMGEVHATTGRVWWGANTVTDQSLTGTGGDNEISLPETDIQSITALSIDEANDGTFTDITVTSLRWNPVGVVQLSDSSEVTQFPDQPGRVKASYTFGNSKPTEEVRRVTLKIVKRLLTEDSDLSEQIDSSLRKLKWNRYGMV